MRSRIHCLAGSGECEWLIMPTVSLIILSLAEALKGTVVVDSFAVSGRFDSDSFIRNTRGL